MGDFMKTRQKSARPDGPSRRLFWGVLSASLVLFFALFFYARAGRSTYDEGAGISYETARVLAVLADDTELDPEVENVRRGSQELRLELLSGRHRGDVAQVTNYLSAFYNVYVKAGDKVAVSVNTLATGEYANICYDREHNSFWKSVGDHIPVHYPGTGDIFAAVLTASLLQGDSLPMAMDRAARYVELTIKTTYSYSTDPREGVMLERTLEWLTRGEVSKRFQSL